MILLDSFNFKIICTYLPLNYFGGGRGGSKIDSIVSRKSKASASNFMLYKNIA